MSVFYSTVEVKDWNGHSLHSVNLAGHLVHLAARPVDRQFIAVNFDRCTCTVSLAESVFAESVFLLSHFWLI